MIRAAVILVIAVAACDGVFGFQNVTGGSGSGGPYAFEQYVSPMPRTGSATVTISMTTPPKEHSLLVVTIGTLSNLPTGVVDNAGNGYLEVSDMVVSRGGSALSMYYAGNIRTHSPFSITVHTVDMAALDQITTVVQEYSGPFGTPALDTSHAAKGAVVNGGTVDSDCGSATTTEPSVEIAALTRDFNGMVSITPEWNRRGSWDLDHTKYAVVATEDRIADAELVWPIFSSTDDAGQPGWACLWATFH